MQFLRPAGQHLASITGMAFVQPLRTALAALLFAVAALPAAALQLGDTKAHILARHGAPGVEDPANKLATYSWDGWTAQLTYGEGLVEKLVYRKNGPLQESEIVSLLQSNGGQNRWREIPPSDGFRQWRRDDGAFAEYAAGQPTGMVFSVTRPPETQPVAALTPAPAPAPIVISSPTPAPIVATPVVALDKAPLPAAPRIETAPTPVEIITHVAAPSHPRQLVAVEQPAPEISAPSETERAEPVELKPIAAQEPKSRALAVQPAAPVPAPASAAPAARRVGFGVIAIFVVLTGLIAGLVLVFRKRLLNKPHGQSFNPISHSQGSAAASIPALDALRWDQFELLVAETYRREDYIVEISAGLDAESGTDLTLRRDSETFLVQCKHWKTACVAEREVREFYGTMAATGAPQGIIATLGTFSRDAQTFAAEKGIELLDRAALEQRIEATARPGEDLCEVAGWIDDFVAHARIFDPECPVCNGSMVTRQSRTGGAVSWGCRSYPRCPGKREPRPDLLAVAAGR
jgi:HJR/Mrr/RecB family endonuclease